MGKENLKMPLMLGVDTLAKTPPSKTDTYRVILKKNRTVCLKHSLSDTNPLIQEQRNKTQTLIKKRPSRFSTKKRKKKRQKKTNPKIQTVYPD